MKSMHLVLLSSDDVYPRNIIKNISTELALNKVICSVVTDHNDLDDSSDMVFLVGYDRIVDEQTIARLQGRLAVFHSSDLPKGRGWGPIYAAIASHTGIHTITLCYVNKNVDAGNILLKARVPVPENYTGAMLRSVGKAVIEKLICRYARHFIGDLPLGLKQEGEPSYNRRRKPEDSEVRIDSTLGSLMPHILASEPPNAAFINYRGEKFRLIALPENQKLRSEFVIEEYFDGKLGRTVTIIL